MRFALPGSPFCLPRGFRADAPKVTFLRDVAPILNKVGCTSGTCHGAAKGKNGFKLSLRGYDPQFDYEALLYDLSGRRFNRADPGAQPDAGQADAASGAWRRTAIRNRTRDYYKTIYNWIAQGVPFGDPAARHGRRLEVEPQGDLHERRPANRRSVKVTAHLSRTADRATSRAKRPSTATSPMSRPWPTPTVKGARIGRGHRCWSAIRASSPRCR